MVIMLVALSNFVAGSIVGPENELEEAKGFIGYSGTVLTHREIIAFINTTNLTIFLCAVDTLNENWKSAYFVTDGQMQNFISVFSVYFPASIGILAGANVSGDLKVSKFFLNKRSAILKIFI